MKTTQIFSAVSFALVISGPACNAKFVPIGDEDAGSVGTGGSGATCEYNGVFHPVGTSFRSSDGCNTCSCDSFGKVACTLMACLSSGGTSSVGGATSSGCFYGGNNYAVGASFKSADGCNSCSCDKSGSVACTDMACAVGGASGAGGSPGQTCSYNGVNYALGASFKSTDGCNSCSCTASGVACTLVYCGVGGASAAGGSSGVTCSYNGVNYSVGSTFKSTDGCNTCSCTTAGVAVCTKMACQGAGGSTGVDCPAIPTIMPDCGSVKPIMAYDANSCPKGYVCPVCVAPKPDVPKCDPGVTLTTTYDVNGCVNGYVCSNCPLIDIAKLDCGPYAQAVGTYDKNGCMTGLVCPICDAIAYSLPDCGTVKPVGVYSVTGCVQGFVCPGCPTTTQPPIPCAKFTSVVDPTTGCATSYSCE